MKTPHILPRNKQPVYQIETGRILNIYPDNSHYHTIPQSRNHTSHESPKPRFSCPQQSPNPQRPQIFPDQKKYKTVASPYTSLLLAPSLAPHGPTCTLALGLRGSSKGHGRLGMLGGGGSRTRSHERRGRGKDRKSAEIRRQTFVLSNGALFWLIFLYHNGCILCIVVVFSVL